MLIVANYHYVRPRFDAPYPGIHGITPDQLEAQLRLLGAIGEFVDCDQVRDAAAGGASLPPRAILVSFDDGLREQYEHALPVLQRLHVRAVFFANTYPLVERRVSTVHKIHLLRAHTAPAQLCELLQRSADEHGAELEFDTADAAAMRQYRYDTLADARVKYALNFLLPQEQRDHIVGSCFRTAFAGEEAAISAELYVDQAQLRELEAWGVVGTHGHKHVPLGQLSRAEVAESVGASIDLLAEWTGARPYAVSYPYGSREACGGEASEGAADAGIDLGFTMERAANVYWRAPLHLGRFDCNDLPGGKSPRFDDARLFDDVPQASWRFPLEASVAGQAD